MRHRYDERLVLNNLGHVEKGGAAGGRHLPSLVAFLVEAEFSLRFLVRERLRQMTLLHCRILLLLRFTE